MAEVSCLISALKFTSDSLETAGDPDQLQVPLQVKHLFLYSSLLLILSLSHYCHLVFILDLNFFPSSESWFDRTRLCAVFSLK